MIGGGGCLESNLDHEQDWCSYESSLVPCLSGKGTMRKKTAAYSLKSLHQNYAGTGVPEQEETNSCLL